jgi:hypothetical protein
MGRENTFYQVDEIKHLTEKLGQWVKKHSPSVLQTE